MDPSIHHRADTLVDKIFSWVELMEECADKLKQLADDMEETQKGVNVTKVVGSSVSVAGAAAMTAAGVATFFTAGAALPVIALAGGVASWLGLATNATSDVVNVTVSITTLKEAEDVVKKIVALHREMMNLVKSLKEEQQKKGGYDGSCTDDYMIELILRAMAKRNGLILEDSISLMKILETHFHQAVRSMRRAFKLLDTSRKLAVITIISECLPILLAKLGGKASKALTKEVAGKTAGKAVGRIAGGGLGLLISVPELVINCKNLDVSETEASKSLRENAKVIQDESEEMKEDLQQILKLFQRLAKVKHCIQNTAKSNDDKKLVIEFAMEFFNNEVTQKWLKENSDGEILFILLKLFESVRKEIAKKEEEEEKKKRKKKEIDITFVAHGAINSDSMIPARCLLPPHIKDVLLYSPWNCLITAEAAYGIATGDIKPEHRLFGCADTIKCTLDDQQHQPRYLPRRWNLMRKAGNQTIPNITVSPKKTPYDGAFEKFKVLEDKYGSPNTNRVVILYMPPGPRVPFYVVTLALGLVLFFSDYEATVHLAACLRDNSKVDRKEYLQQQYACTINNTGMTVKSDLYPITDGELYRALKAVFGETHSMY